MRIDKYLSERFGSRNKAVMAIEKGLVLVDGKRVQPSYNFVEGQKIDILQAEENFVSVGGFKLSKALKDFNYSPKGKVFVDIGASTGGFTDCLLQNGAKKVYCIDVGESQLDKSLLTEKVVVIDNFNARDLDSRMFSEKIDGVVIDVSFISLTYILKAVSNILESGGEVLALIKPQFECDGVGVGKNGIVKDSKVHEKVIDKICNFSIECALTPIKITNAPIVQGKNLEYVIFLQKNAKMINNTKFLIKSVKL
jgi:23S rRNA (cytidine1920-2'-O)/16S rRNA (cytidine1409-2'-O)-methyltransferase